MSEEDTERKANDEEEYDDTNTQLASQVPEAKESDETSLSSDDDSDDDTGDDAEGDDAEKDDAEKENRDPEKPKKDILTSNALGMCSLSVPRIKKLIKHESGLSVGGKSGVDMIVESAELAVLDILYKSASEIRLERRSNSEKVQSDTVRVSERDILVAINRTGIYHILQTGDAIPVYHKKAPKKKKEGEEEETTKSQKKASTVSPKKRKAPQGKPEKKKAKKARTDDSE